MRANICECNITGLDLNWEIVTESFCFFQNYLAGWQVFVSFLHEYISDFCTIQIWRSFWTLQDLYIYPENPDKRISGLVSLLFGIAVYVLFYVSNKHINKVLVKSYNLMFVRFVNCVCLMGIVSVWRGLWLLQFEYTYPMHSSANMKILICFITLIVASILIFLTNHGSATLSRSCCKDDLFFVEKKFLVMTSFSKFAKQKRVSKTTQLFMYAHF